MDRPANSLAEAAIRQVAASKPDPDGPMELDIAADELWHAAKGDDRGAFRKAVKSLLDIAKSDR